MPYVRRRRTVRRSRRPRSTRYSRRKRMYRVSRKKFTGNSMRPTVMPIKFKFTTRYFDSYKTITATPGTSNQYVFNATSLYDPDQTGTGHQPVGFDNLMVFYDHYCVIACKIKIVAQNESDQHPCIVALQVNDDGGTVSNNVNTLIENGQIKWRRLERQGSDGNFINNVKSTCTLTKAVSIPKFLSKSKILTCDECKGTINNSPLENVFFKVIVAGIDQSADAVTVSFSVQMDFVAILTEPKNVIGS